MASRQPPVLAAGAVCWRVVDGVAKVLVVHRTQHQDVSLPKGKVDPGESLPETAVREILEETGLGIVLGVPLGSVEYVMPNGRDKFVQYWAAEVNDHALELARFTPNDEIASLEWLPVAKARKKLSYPHDVEVVDLFDELFQAGRARTFAIIAERHGKAVPPSAWDGSDASRPLLVRGTEQAASSARGIAAFGPQKIISSTAARCLATAEPVGTVTGLPVKATHDISQDSYEMGTARVTEVIAKRLKRRENAVLVSHGPVLPEIIQAIATATNTPPNGAVHEAAMMGTGDFTVIHIPRDAPRTGIVAIESHPAAV